MDHRSLDSTQTNQPFAKGLLNQIAVGVFGLLALATLLLAIFNERGMLQVRDQAQKLTALEADIQKIEAENKSLTDEIHQLRTDRTTILIAHRESTIRLADRVVLLEDGRAVASGAHEQLLMHEPRYARVLASTEHTHKPLPPSSYAATIAALAAMGDPGALGGVGA